MEGVFFKVMKGIREGDVAYVKIKEYRGVFGVGSRRGFLEVEVWF